MERLVKKTVFLMAGFMILALQACIYPPFFPVVGNGDYCEEERVVPDFTKVEVNLAADVVLYLSDSIEYHTVCIRAESNLLPYIETLNTGQVLIIGTHQHNLINKYPIKIFIGVNNLDRIKLDGSGSIVCRDSLNTDNMEIILAGSGKISLKGYANHMYARLSGSGNIELQGEFPFVEMLLSGSGNIYLYGQGNESYIHLSGSGNVYGLDFNHQSSEIDVSGSGNDWVHVNDFLNAHISGSGNIYYKGEPEVNVHISGSGKIIQIN